MQDGDDRGLTRRTVLRDGAVLTMAAFGLREGSALAGVLVPVPRTTTRFVTPAEMQTLRALVDRIVPGRPEMPEDGGVVAGCAEAVDALLGAFTVDPPLIFAGGPFSDRGGAPVNDFEDFVPLDAYEAKAWRLRIEGSQGRPELEFNGRVKGWQTVYREGLAALDRAAAPARFAALPGPARDLILRTSRDGAIDDLMDVAVPHTLALMYGAPEYQGNKDLLGWRYTNYDGDVLPRGYTREEIEEPDRPGISDVLPPLPASMSLADVLAAVPVSSAEVAHGIVARSGDSLRALRAEVQALRDAVKRGTDGR